MRGARPLAVVLILSMLSACAGTRAPDNLARDGDPGTESEGPPAGYSDAVEAAAPDLAYQDPAALRRDGYYRPSGDYPVAHYHEEPDPQQQAVAEAVLLLTASAFVCTFVVVVLDGACQFGAQAGYYY